MRRVVFALVPALVLAGCSELPALVGPPAGGAPTDWEVAVEDSMAPDFSGMGETYPMLLVHQHLVASKRQLEERRTYVCYTTGGEPLPLLGARGEDMAAAPCMGPPMDAATGRVFADAASFASTGPVALVGLMDACRGGVAEVGGDVREFVVATPAHAFTVVYHENRSFSVDGVWLQPGSAPKVSYYVHRGSEMDEQFVRVVFDHPGEWLRSRIAPYDPALDAGVPPRPDQGSGLRVDVPVGAASLRAPLERVAAATPDGGAVGVAALRAVHDGERLTELTIVVSTERGSVTWYSAGRAGGELMMLGAEAGPLAEPSVPVEEVLETFDMSWRELRAGAPGAMTDVRLDMTRAWSGPAGLPLMVETDAAPQDCAEGCVLVRADDALVPPSGESSAWRRVVAPESSPSEAARTLHVLAFTAADAAPAEVWWHAP